MPTWMVVEDEPDIYEVLLAMFEIWGIEGVAFVDGEEAVAWIDEVDRGEFKGELPELALLDIRLPGRVSGPKVGERMRQSPKLRDAAIVLTTAYRLTKSEEKAVKEQAGADHLLYKPLPKINELRKVLEKALITHRVRNTKPEPSRVAVPNKPATLPELGTEADTDTLPAREEEK